jgi:hypothetical protein
MSLRAIFDPGPAWAGWDEHWMSRGNYAPTRRRHARHPMTPGAAAGGQDESVAEKLAASRVILYTGSCVLRGGKGALSCDPSIKPLGEGLSIRLRRG